MTARTRMYVAVPILLVLAVLLAPSTAAGQPNTLTKHLKGFNAQPQQVAINWASTAQAPCPAAQPKATKTVDLSPYAQQLLRDRGWRLTSCGGWMMSSDRGTMLVVPLELITSIAQTQRYLLDGTIDNTSWTSVEEVTFATDGSVRITTDAAPTIFSGTVLAGGYCVTSVVLAIPSGPGEGPTLGSCAFAMATGILWDAVASILNTIAEGRFFTIETDKSPLSVAQSATGTATIRARYLGDFNGPVTFMLDPDSVRGFQSDGVQIAISGPSSQARTDSVTLSASAGTKSNVSGRSVRVWARGGGQTREILLPIVVARATGSVTVVATLDGKPWSGTLWYLTSSLPIDGARSVPMKFQDVLTGPFTVTVFPTGLPVGGGPANADYVGMEPAKPEIVPNASQIVTLKFKSRPTPDFSLGVAASTTVVRGSSVSVPVTISMLDGNSGRIDLSALNSAGQPQAGAKFNPGAATLLINGSTNSSLSIVADASTPIGSFNVTVQGRQGSLTHTLPLRINVLEPPDMVVRASSPAPAIKGTTISVPVEVALSLGAVGTVTLSAATSTPALGTLRLSTATLGLSTNGNGKAVLSVSIDSSSPTGTIPVTVQAKLGALVRSVTVAVTVVNPPDLSLQVTSPAAMARGTAFSVPVSLRSLNAFAGNVSLSVSGLAPGTSSGGFAPQTVSLQSNGSSFSYLKINTTSSSPKGTFNVLITATGGGLTRTATASITIK